MYNDDSVSGPSTPIIDDVPASSSNKSHATNLDRIEAGLRRARAAIKEPKHDGNQTHDRHYDQLDPDYVPEGPIYRNAKAFYR